MRFCLLLLLLLAALGCSDLTCGSGTHEESGECVANVLTACGQGTRYSNGYCRAVADAGAACGDTAVSPADSGPKKTDPGAQGGN